MFTKFISILTKPYIVAPSSIYLATNYNSIVSQLNSKFTSVKCNLFRANDEQVALNEYVKTKWLVDYQVKNSPQKVANDLWSAYKANAPSNDKLLYYEQIKVNLNESLNHETKKILTSLINEEITKINAANLLTRQEVIVARNNAMLSSVAKIV